MSTEEHQSKSKKSCPRSYIKKMEKLKKEGFKIKVRHDRLYHKYERFVQQTLKKDYVYHLLVHEILMTKGEMKKLGLTDYELQNYGGQTKVSILKDDQLISEGIAKVNNCDHFVRHTGLEIAMGRAQKRISNEI